MRTLYEILNMKRENSIYKSVFVTDRYTFENYRIIEVEPYDDTFINAISSLSKYDKTLDKIMLKVYNYMQKIGINESWLSVYTDEYGQQEILLNEYYMKEVFKLIK